MFSILQWYFKCFKIIKLIYKKTSKHDFYFVYLKDSLNVLKL